MIRVRKPGEEGYLGPAAEAQRAAEIARARAASPKRSMQPQKDTMGLGLFAAYAEPSLF